MQAIKAELKAIKRIKRRGEFLHIQNNGVKWVSKALTLQAASNESDCIRIGFTVSRRTSRSAVTRNRIKRRLRAVAADILPSLAKEGHDYILVGRPLAESRPYSMLKNDLLWCLKKLDLTK